MLFIPNYLKNITNIANNSIDWNMWRNVIRVIVHFLRIIFVDKWHKMNPNFILHHLFSTSNIKTCVTIRGESRDPSGCKKCWPSRAQVSIDCVLRSRRGGRVVAQNLNRHGRGAVAALIALQTSGTWIPIELDPVSAVLTPTWSKRRARETTGEHGEVEE